MASYKALTDSYIAEHSAAFRGEQRFAPTLYYLRSEILKRNLSHIWTKILHFDYDVSSVDELPHEKQLEFANVISLLLDTFD